MGQVILSKEFHYCIFLSLYLQDIFTPGTIACVES